MISPVTMTGATACAGGVMRMHHMDIKMKNTFNSFSDFYAFYLTEHSSRACRRLHFIGSSIVLIMLVYAFITQNWWVMAYAPIAAYGLAWMGHLFFEKNKPATFKYPMYSFMGDWVMYKDILVGKIKF